PPADHPPPPATMSSALVLAVYALTFSVGLPANAFTLAALAAKSRRRPSPAEPGRASLTTADLLLLNLTSADLLLLLFLP
ncbi:FFAR3 protein, partial [Leiothrix lutea]|nr:FFAR3 protein [Leiothrix lutea]